jgi:hypothetical protein
MHERPGLGRGVLQEGFAIEVLTKVFYEGCEKRNFLGVSLNW